MARTITKNVHADSYILLTLKENENDKVACDADYEGRPQELIAMIAYAVKNISADMGISTKKLMTVVESTINLMDEED